MNQNLHLVAALLLAAGPLRGQHPVALTRGQTVEADLTPSSTHHYTITLVGRQFVYGEVDQRSVDVVVTVYSPNGVRLGRFDVRGSGPEPFQLRAIEAGTYSIAVTPYQGDSGHYAITVRLVDRLATSPEGRVDQIMTPYTGGDRPGGVVAVTRNGRIVFARGYGMANLEDGIANTPSTVYHMASVSKQFTAFAIAMLADQGRLSLDDDVRRYLPNLPDFGTTITVRNLLTHTSGLREEYTLWATSGGLLDDVIRQQDLLRLVERQRELNFAPGTEFLYTNTDYTLLAEIVAKVSGQSFRDWMRTNVFAPLGMTSTQISDDYGRLVPRRAYSYRNDDGLRKAVLNYANVGSTGLLTTATDLARWLRNWRTGEVGGPRVLAMMQERGILARGDTIAYALGIRVETYRGLRRFAHLGADAGYRTSLSYFPTIDAGVIVLSNSAEFSVGTVADQVADDFFETAMAPRSPGPVVVAPAVLRSLVGNFALAPDSDVVFTTESDSTLFMEVPGQLRFPLTPLADTVFRVDAPGIDAQIRFESNPDGVVTRGAIQQNGVHPFRRINPWTPDAKELSAYVGRYYSSELETLYTLVVKDGVLVARHRRLGDIPLKPLDHDVFDGGTFFLHWVRFERDSAKSLTGMRVTGTGVFNLLFQKMP